MNEVHAASGGIVCAVFVFFIAMGTFTILNMLIGFQCEVAARVSRADKENVENTFLRNNLLPILECYDQDGSHYLEKGEFTLLLHDPQVHDILGNFGTKIQDLLHLRDIIYEDKYENFTRSETLLGAEELRCAVDKSFYQNRLSFNEFIDV